MNRGHGYTVRVRRFLRWCRTREGTLFLGMLFAAFLVRLPFLGFPGYYQDLQGYVIWGQGLTVHFWDFYSYGATSLSPPPAYPPLAEYLFGLLAGTYPAVAHLFGASPTLDSSTVPLLAAYFKLPVVLADLATVALIFALARRVLSSRWALIAAATYAFAPAVIFDSAVWGQTEALFTLMVVLALVCTLDRRAVAAGVCFAVALMLKPEALIFGPLIPLYLLRWADWRTAARSIAAMAAGGVAICLPFLLPPNPQMLAYQREILPLVGKQAPHISVSSYNAWYLLGVNRGDAAAPFLGPLSAANIGWLFYLAALGVVAVGLWRDGSPVRLYLAAAVLSATFFVFGAQQHERYLFPAMVLLVLAAVYGRSRRLAVYYAVAQGAVLFNMAYIGLVYGYGKVSVQIVNRLADYLSHHPAYTNVAAAVNCWLAASLIANYVRTWPRNGAAIPRTSSVRRDSSEWHAARAVQAAPAAQAMRVEGEAVAYDHK